MTVLDLLIEISREQLHIDIERYGLLNKKTIDTSQRLDKLISRKQKSKVVYNERIISI